MKSPVGSGAGQRAGRGERDGHAARRLRVERIRRGANRLSRRKHGGRAVLAPGRTAISIQRASPFQAPAPKSSSVENSPFDTATSSFVRRRTDRAPPRFSVIEDETDVIRAVRRAPGVRQTPLVRNRRPQRRYCLDVLGRRRTFVVSDSCSHRHQGDDSQACRDRGNESIAFHPHTSGPAAGAGIDRSIDHPHKRLHISGIPSPNLLTTSPLTLPNPGRTFPACAPPRAWNLTNEGPCSA